MGKAKINKISKKGAKHTIKRFRNSLPAKKHKRNHRKYLSAKNPKITFIRNGSNFIYDIETFQEYFSQAGNKNNLKLKLSELNFLKDKIDEIKVLNDISDSNKLSISLELFNKINSFICPKKHEDDTILYIKNLIEHQHENGFLSCRRIAKKFEEDTGRKISKTKVHNILRNKLNYKFLKTTIKNSKINENKNICISLCFLKILIKCLLLKYKIIFVDETNIQAYNNNYKVWRKTDQNIYYNLGSNKRKNLIAAIDENRVLTYSINNNNTDEKIFLEFMIKLKEKIDSMKIKDFVIILDNLSCHKTPLLKEFYIKNKLNILFNSPYQSMFNCIELFFRIIKRKLYQNIYPSTDSAMLEVEKIITDEKLSDGLIKNFRETLQVYYDYSLKYKDINLNNLEISE